jgi:hypothetical protein
VFVRSTLLLVLFFPVICGGVFAQSSAQDPLYQTVSRLDAQLFHAYNTCDLKTFRSLLDDNIEFYHDKTGLMVGGDKVTEAVHQNICGKVTRELVGKLEVYPLEGYGAVEIGVHRFVHPNEPGNVGEAKFVEVWHNENGSWKLTRVLSFDHHSAE